MKSIFLVFAVLLSFNASAELRAKNQEKIYKQFVIDKVYKRDFVSLEKEATTLTTQDERMEDGLSKLSLFYNTLYEAFGGFTGPKGWESLDAELTLLQAKDPSSVNATFMHVTAMQAKAWEIRGSGYANTLTQLQWYGFQAFMLKARDVLDEQKARLSGSPVWYTKRVAIGLYTNEPKSKLKAIFQEGAGKFPDYEGLFFNMGLVYFARWGGSLSEMETFINESSKYSTKRYGNPMPARILWIALEEYPELLSTTGYGFINRNVKANGKQVETPRSGANSASKIADWDLINASMLDVLKHFPSDWNAQNFLYFACQRGDKAQAQLLLPYIKEASSAELFRANLQLFDGCKRWATGNHSFVMRSSDGSMRLLR